jgi:hypothetical protein
VRKFLYQGKMEKEQEGGGKPTFPTCKLAYLEAFD